nr:venom protein [Lampona murina]
MKHLSLVFFALAVVLCDCKETADVKNTLALKSEEGRGDRCLAIDERCYSLCDCCGANTDCVEGSWVRWFCRPGTWRTCYIKKDMCKDHPIWKEHTSSEKCKKG